MVKLHQQEERYMTHPFQQNPLIPETPILVYPSLAATIGLEEAAMLSVLTGITRSYRGLVSNGYRWYSLDEGAAMHLMPFWQATDIQRVSTNLREQGLIIIASAPFSTGKLLKFAFNEKAEEAQVQHAAAPVIQQPQAHFQAQQGKTLISPSWQPDSETLSRIAQHNIPNQFSMEQLPEFLTFWRDSGETARSWGSKFMRHVIHKWREFEAQQNAQNKNTHMTRNWRPSQDAIEFLNQQSGISLPFMEDSIAEFELYWRERGDKCDNWNYKFRSHVKHQWAIHQSACKYDPTPRRISENWQPSNEVYEALQTYSNIDMPFAQTILPEFVIYWRGTNKVYTSWDSRFLQYVKQCWAKRDISSNSTIRSTRDLSIEEQLTDRSWIPQ